MIVVGNKKIFMISDDWQDASANKEKTYGEIVHVDNDIFLWSLVMVTTFCYKYNNVDHCDKDNNVDHCDKDNRVKCIKIVKTRFRIQLKEAMTAVEAAFALLEINPEKALRLADSY